MRYNNRMDRVLVGAVVLGTLLSGCKSAQVPTVSKEIEYKVMNPKVEEREPSVAEEKQFLVKFSEPKIGFTTERANLRHDASKSAGLIVTLPKDIQIAATGQKGEWIAVKVISTDGNENRLLDLAGWVHEDYLNFQ